MFVSAFAAVIEPMNTRPFRRAVHYGDVRSETHWAEACPAGSDLGADCANALPGHIQSQLWVIC